MSRELKGLIEAYKSDDESVFNTWFINNEERLKAFRSIRRGVRDVVNDIKNGSFGNDYKGSSLEFVLNCITEQSRSSWARPMLFIGSQSLESLISMRTRGTKWPLPSFSKAAPTRQKKSRS